MNYLLVIALVIALVFVLATDVSMYTGHRTKKKREAPKS